MTAALAVRSSTGQSAGILAGLAVPYNAPTVITTPFGKFRETIARGALDSALKGAHGKSVAFLRDHQSSLLLGRRGAGTLDLVNTMAGLRARVTLPDTAMGHDTFRAVERRDLSGMSFAFTIAEDGDTWHEPDDKGGLPLRMITKIERLYEVSAVAFPAYEGSTTLHTDEESRSLIRLRQRALELQIAMTGGFVHVGKRTAPPLDLRPWLAQHRWRVGRRAVATPPDSQHKEPYASN